jgi:hypothetical protein
MKSVVMLIYVILVAVSANAADPLSSDPVIARVRLKKPNLCATNGGCNIKPDGIYTEAEMKRRCEAAGWPDSIFTPDRDSRYVGCFGESKEVKLAEYDEMIARCTSVYEGLQKSVIDTVNEMKNSPIVLDEKTREEIRQIVKEELRAANK